MPRRKKNKPKAKQVLQVKQDSPEDLEAFIREASEVKQLTQHPGWGIIARDLTLYRNGLMDKIVYIDPSKPESREARVLFIAVDKIFALINDYQENRDRAIELLNKLENPDLAVTMDVDNEI